MFRKTPTIYLLKNLIAAVNSGNAINYRGDMWGPARPTGFFCLRQRCKAAWLVFRGRADAVVWPEDEEPPTDPLVDLLEAATAPTWGQLAKPVTRDFFRTQNERFRRKLFPFEPPAAPEEWSLDITMPGEDHNAEGWLYRKGLAPFQVIGEAVKETYDIFLRDHPWLPPFETLEVEEDTRHPGYYSLHTSNDYES